jgi:thiol-disulfide isomerase/thioredoxin
MAAWLAARLLACGLLVAGLAGTGAADQGALAPLLKTLDLHDYTAHPAPPDFSGRTVDPRPLSIAEYRGSAIILNFWASWCLECRPEMPGLERLQREFSSQGLAVIGVNAREDKEAARRTLYGVVGLPTTFVIGRDGRAIVFAVGPRQWESALARALITALLAEPAQPPSVQ